MEFEIQLRSVSDVQAFVALATAQPFPVTVADVRHCVNGKSFMEIFCLNVSRPLLVSANCTEEAFLRFRQAALPFLKD